jgi:hypothetical protein
LGIMESKIIAFLFGLVYCNSRKTNQVRFYGDTIYRKT